MQIRNDLLKVALWAALLFVPFLGAVHLFDWDEINFAESAREMMLTGEYFRVQINFQPFWEKPPLFFWLQTLSMKVFGVNEFAARFPNAVCGILVLCTIFYIGRKYFSRRLAMFWVLMMTASLTPHLYYKSGIIDPFFNYFILLSVWMVFEATQQQLNSQRTKYYILAGAFNGLAVLTKGPVALLILLLCCAVLFVIRRFKPFFNIWQPFLALLIVLAITSVWFMNELLKNGFTVLSDFIAYQVDLFRNPVAGHGQPFYYHAVVIFFGCFPASIIAITGFGLKRRNDEPVQRAWKQMMNIMFWVVLVLFSMVTTKIVHYSSLCYVPLTFIAAYKIDDLLYNKEGLKKWQSVLLLVIGLIIGSLFMILPMIESFKGRLIPLIKDDFAVASLGISAPWTGIEWIVGFMFILVIVAFFILHQRNNVITALYVLLFSFSILLPLYIQQVAPKIEVYSQKPAIEFYESLQDKDCYVETLGFKSYAQYFYPRTKPQSNPNYSNRDWLLSGPIDKPAYFVAKINHADEYRSFPIKEIGRKGGFVFFERLPEKP